MIATTVHQAATRAASRSRRLLAVGLLTALAVTIFAIRLAGPPVLVDNEYRLGACVLNVVQGGNWLVPHDSLGNTDKPPMLTWLSALVSLVLGRVDRFTLYLPTALATFALALIVFTVAHRHFGWQAGLFGGIVYLLNNFVAQQMATARWDGLFAFTIALVALAAFQGWTLGRRWVLFWIAAAAATLTKGPLGIVLGSFGLLAVLWERRSGEAHQLRGSQVMGIALYLLIVGGWFLASYVRVGPHLIDDMIRSELVGHAVMGRPGHRFVKPLTDFLANFAPWSVLTLLGLWRIWARPATDLDVRRFERFCFWWFVGGLLLFALSPHNPARLLFPIVPPAAIIAGRELQRFARAIQPRTLRLGGTAAAVIMLTVLIIKYQYIDRMGEHVRKTHALLELEETVRNRVGDDVPLTFASDVPFALQLSFNIMRPVVSFVQAATLIRDDLPAYVVVVDAEKLRREMGTDSPPLYEVASSEYAGKPYLRIMSNRPRLESTDSAAIGLGPLRLRLRGVRLGATQDGGIVLERWKDSASVTVTNGGHEAKTVTLSIADGNGPRREVRRLEGGESWLAAPLR